MKEKDRGHFSERDILMTVIVLIGAAIGIVLIAIAEREGTAEWYEYVWLGIGVIGSSLVLWMMRDLVIDRAILRTDGVNGADQMLNATAIGINIWLFGIVATIAFLGFVAIAIPASPNGESAEQFTLTRITLTLSLFLIAVCADGAALWMRFRRRMLRAYLRQKYRAETISGVAHSDSSASQERQDARRASE